MSKKPHENLMPIRFAGELLPDQAQLLDLAARLCPVSRDTRAWFSAFTNCSGVDDARTVIDHCTRLRSSIREHQTSIIAALRHDHEDTEPSKILGAWIYTLDTMTQVAQTHKTCSWIIEGLEDKMPHDSDGGDITLRRV